MTRKKQNNEKNKAGYAGLAPKWNPYLYRLVALALYLVLFPRPVSAASFCATPGADGSPSALSGTTNTYYPGIASVSAGVSSIPVGSSSGNSAQIAAGDLLLVIQMQDADISYSNGANYGATDGSGSGYTALNQTGVYEYALAAGPVSGGHLAISGGLTNSYRVRAASGTNGQSSFQVVRVPQYLAATVSGTVAALPWNGSVGGVVALDVAGALTVNGAITADGAGFRGGLGRRLGGGGGLNSDYLTSYQVTNNGSKGEGVAGTPQYLNSPSTFNGAPVPIGLLGSGYPDGATANASYGCGAPGNAGGGGTDGHPATNGDNSGGGGGGNYSAGAQGGNSWSSNLPVGGRGGSAVAGLAFNLAIMGGGGGAGTTDDGTADANTYANPPGIGCSDPGLTGVCSSGAPGGGIILVRANSIAGSGMVTANGGSGYNTGNDAAGGGGAGGSIVLDIQTGSAINVAAKGGDGGNAWRSANGSSFPGNRHGPGGAGSGGFIAYSPAGLSVAATVTPGTSGKTTTIADSFGTGSSGGGTSSFKAPNRYGPLPGAACQLQLSGKVFEDVNYGGGAGRDLSAAGAVVRSGARVELFDNGGNYVTFATSDASGLYTFASLSAGTYSVRVVNSSVTSSRPGYASGLLPVQTYRTDASSGSALSVTDRVGGEVPSKADAGNGSTTLAALVSATTAAQSVTTVTLGAANVGGVDFGFNFDTIVNKNDAGQGTLRQFILNANGLGNAGLAQTGQSAGSETSIFMISDGNAHPGLRAGLANQLTAGVAVIPTATALPAVTDSYTVLDGSTQTANVGVTNLNGLEIEIAGNGVTGSGLAVSGATGAGFRGVAIYGFAGSGANGNGIYLNNAAASSVYGCYLGSNASGAAALANSAAGISVAGTSSGTTIGGLASGEGNTIVFNSRSGVAITSSGTGTTIRGNTLRLNGHNGVYCTAPGVLIAKNLIHNNGGAYDGIWLDAGATNAKIYQNTIHGNGRDGIRVGDTGATIKNNICTGNGGYAIDRVAASMTEAYNDLTDAVTAPANAAGRCNVATDTTDLNVNPLYLNAAGFNFGLTECTSPAINQGVDLGVDQPDMNGATAGLWNNNAPELGALETVGSCSPGLAIVKQAWDPNGTAPLASLTAPVGSTIVFLIYVKNTTAGPVTDLRINDSLDRTAFQYQVGSMVRTNSAAPPPDSATDLAIFNATAAGTGTGVSDAVDGDVASAQNTGGPPDVDRITIGAVAGQANASLTLNGHSTFGLRFKVKIK